MLIVAIGVECGGTGLELPRAAATGGLVDGVVAEAGAFELFLEGSLLDAPSLGFDTANAIICAGVWLALPFFSSSAFGFAGPAVRGMLSASAV
jgi:hypothetical protein